MERIRKKATGIAAVFLALVMVLLLAQPMAAYAEEPEQKTIRVAFPTQEGMSFVGHSGKVTGYNYDYLEKIAEYTGWQMDYVLYASNDGNEAVGSAIADLQNGNVDLMGPLLKNAATEEMFEFPEHSYGTSLAGSLILLAGTQNSANDISWLILAIGSK